MMNLHDVESLDQYCLKTETRLVLLGTGYYTSSVGVRLGKFLETFEKDEDYINE